MFFTYLRRELRGRMRQAIFIALGLAVGIGLVIIVTAASSGVKKAQGTVLQNLYGVGTSATVTKSPTAGSFTRPRRNFNFKPGSTVKINQLTATGSLGSLDDSAITTISKLNGVAAAAGAVTANNVNTTFKIPNFNSGGGGSGGAPGGGAPGGGGSGGSFRGPRSFSAGNQVTVNGADLSSGGQPLGPLSNGTLSSGRTLKASDANSDVAVVDSSYARSASLKVGSQVKIAGKKFPVIGIVKDPSGTDIYIPLARAQALASMKGKVNTVYVAATSATDIAAVQKEIRAAVPGATVTTSASLASEVTGSLSSASSLANNLGRWLAIAVLIAAFLLASLLTMAAVARRVREFGTLKALGWRSRRIIGQVMGESVAIGIIGGIAGVGLRVRRRRDHLRRGPGPDRVGRADHRLGDPRGRPVLQRPGRLHARRRGRPRPGRCERQPDRGRAPHRPGHDRRGCPSRGAGPGRGPDRRGLRRLARGPAAPGCRAVPGGVTGPPARTCQERKTCTS